MEPDMRNINQHPITKAEKISALNHAIETHETSAKLGDIRPAALKAVLRDITDVSEPSSTVFKELDWQCGNWWYSKTILGLYEYKNWDRDKNGPAWLHFPDETRMIPCKTIDEAKAKAWAHYTNVIGSALTEPAV
jgi:hypothetical protein